MYIVLNGKKFQVNKKDTIAQLLKKIDIKSSKVAIEVNKVVVPKSKYKNRIIYENDVIEVLELIGGG